MKTGDFVRTVNKGILDHYIGYIRTVTSHEEYPYRVEFGNGWAFALAETELRPTNQTWKYIPDAPSQLFSDDPMASFVLDMLPSSAITNPVEFINRANTALREQFPDEAFTRAYSETLVKTAAAYYGIPIIYPEVDVVIVNGAVVVQEKAQKQHEPATAKQLAYLRDLNAWYPADITKSAASELIEDAKQQRRIVDSSLYYVKPRRARCEHCGRVSDIEDMVDGNGGYDWDNRDEDFQGSIHLMSYRCADGHGCQQNRRDNAELSRIAAEVAEAALYDDNSPGQIGGW
jgi:hypothetical protein